MALLLKFTVKVMLVAYDELIESREHEITADNQVAAIRKALEAEGPVELHPPRPSSSSPSPTSTKP
jgi:hypothetical protein